MFNKTYSQRRAELLKEAQARKIQASFVQGLVNESNTMYEARYENYTTTVDGHKKTIVTANRNNFPVDLDISWLAAASQTYDISPDINDYVIVDVPAVTVDIPNRNVQGFLFSEVSYFDYNLARQVYQTFTGAPSCRNHQNQVDQNTDLAKGVIFGTTLQYVPRYDIWKIRVIQGFDRQKCQDTANGLLNKRLRFFSMGSLVSVFIDSITGLIQGSSSATKLPPGSIYNGRLVWSQCLGVRYIENSVVDDPADVTAEGNVLPIALG